MGALVGNVDLVIVRFGDNILCGLHGSDYCYTTGISSYTNHERLPTFTSWVEDGEVMMDADEVATWEREHPQPFDRDAYQGTWEDPHGSPEEPQVHGISSLAEDGLSKVSCHGAVTSMGVPRDQLPSWNSIQVVTAQLARRPKLNHETVRTDITIGPGTHRPLSLDIPIFVSDMSFGALSQEGKTALARGTEAASTGICSGEGGMLPEERAESTRYLYELASGRFGWNLEKVADVQAFHFKFGQGAKTGTGGHLPGIKVKGRIAEVRGLEPGEPAVSPATFVDLRTPADFAELAHEVREILGGIPIGAKLSAQRIEDDLDAALEIGVDYVILDGRGGDTGAAPAFFRDHISVPTIPALARAPRHLDQTESDITSRESLTAGSAPEPRPGNVKQPRGSSWPCRQITSLLETLDAKPRPWSATASRHWSSSPLRRLSPPSPSLLTTPSTPTPTRQRPPSCPLDSGRG